MLMRLKKIGSGTIEDPYTVDLPTWSFFAGTPDDDYMVVDVPNEDAPTDTDARGGARFPIVPVDIIDTAGARDPVTGMRPTRRVLVPILIGLSPAQRIAWRARLRARWESIRPAPSPDTV